MRLVSVAARGLWIDMIAIMHNSEPYGHLIVSGMAIDETTLSRLVGETPSMTRSLLVELEKFKIFSRTGDGTIFSRRMVRDEALRRERAQGGVLSANNPNASRHAESRRGGRPKPHQGVVREPLKHGEGVIQEPLEHGEGVIQEPLKHGEGDIQESLEHGEGDIREPLKGSKKNPPSSSSPSPSSRRSVSNDTVSGGRQRPTVEPGPTFDDLEPDVATFVAIVAAENKSGVITDGRVASLRRELLTVLERVGDRGAFAHGLREAIRRGAGNANYVAKAAAHYAPHQPAPPAAKNPVPYTPSEDELL